MKHFIATTILAVSATMAQADASSYVYEAVMASFENQRGSPVTHEFANCAVRHASDEQKTTILQAAVGPDRDAAVDDVFLNNPAAVACIQEVINRYDLGTELVAGFTR